MASEDIITCTQCLHQIIIESHCLILTYFLLPHHLLESLHHVETVWLISMFVSGHISYFIFSKVCLDTLQIELLLDYKYEIKKY